MERATIKDTKKVRSGGIAVSRKKTESIDESRRGRETFPSAFGGGKKRRRRSEKEVREEGRESRAHSCNTADERLQESVGNILGGSFLRKACRNP